MTEPVPSSPPPEPQGYCKWLVIGSVGLLWLGPAVLLPHDLATTPSALLLSEAVWLGLGLALLFHGLSWLRVQLTVDGVIKHGFFRDVTIPWHDARASRVGLTIKISSTTHSISLNPLVYETPARLHEFLSHHLPSST